MIRLLANGPGDRSSIPSQVIPKINKYYSIPPRLTFSIVAYRSMANGTIQRMKQYPPQHLSVAAIEKRAFWSSSTTVGQVTHLLICNVYLSIYLSIYLRCLLQVKRKNKKYF